MKKLFILGLLLTMSIVRAQVVRYYNTIIAQSGNDPYVELVEVVKVEISADNNYIYIDSVTENNPLDISFTLKVITLFSKQLDSFGNTYYFAEVTDGVESGVFTIWEKESVGCALFLEGATLGFSRKQY